MKKDNKELKTVITDIKEKEGGFDTILHRMSREWGQSLSEEEIKGNLDTRIVELILGIAETGER